MGTREIDLPPPPPPPKATLKRLIAMSKQDWIYGVFGAIGSILAGAINPAFALIISQVLNAYYNPDFGAMKTEVSKWALVFVGVGVASPFVYVCQHYSLGVFGENLVKSVRVKMFSCKCEEATAFVLPSFFGKEEYLVSLRVWSSCLVLSCLVLPVRSRSDYVSPDFGLGSDSAQRNGMVRPG